MTRLWNDPSEFADEMVDGFARAHSRYVHKVYGGVARATRSETPTVSVVIGGGSGHYPAFAGLVGPGLAHGAAMGNLFASPSSMQIESVARIADQGAGVLFAYGRYAGDVLHFDAAQARLREQGVDCRTVTVTDDIFSAPPERRDERRGIAGDLAVFKIAGAAAAAGYDLDGVERVAQLANARTRTLGVAFSGCTLPGASEPLFSVPDGRMAIGLGIHGEPGIDETDVPTADGLAELLVERLLDPVEIPDGVDAATARAVPILNGLGSVKNEELFVVYSGVADRLEKAGVKLLDPQIGEFCTSFDMAGVSLTLVWVDDELERLWSAPADTPAFRTGAVTPEMVGQPVDREAVATAARDIPEASDTSRDAARIVEDALAAVATLIDAEADELGRIDAIAGDGDHGIGMQRGARAGHAAATDAVERSAGAGTTLALAGDAWSNRGGGTSGALWGVMLREIGTRLGDADAADRLGVADGVGRARDAVLGQGGATPGDKTMVDALVPFADTLGDRVAAGDELAVAWRAAADAAQVGAASTADMLPGKGRARSHGDRAVGTRDPGAVSLALIADAVAEVLAGAGSCSGGAASDRVSGDRPADLAVAPS